LQVGCVEMDMILYHGQPNGPSFSVLATLAETGLSADCRPINLLAAERHVLSGITEPLARDMGVEGEGPVLVVAGEAMTESVFIAQFLDEVAGSGLQPKDAYAHWQMLMWCRRITERCAPAAAFLGCRAYASASLDDSAMETIHSDDLRARWCAVQAGDYPELQVHDSETKINDAVALVEAQLADGREWLMGPLTIADFETYGWLAGMASIVLGAFANRPLTDAWMSRVRARPSVQVALAKATVQLPERDWAPGPEINRWG
jgi:GSH-dependent disulfide-bond oxidoreductase